MNARLFAASLCLPLLTACSTYEKNEPDAHVTRVTDDRYEIEIRYYGRAYNPHSLSPFPFSYRASSWLYLSALEGSVPGSEVVVTSEKGKLEGYAADRFQKGMVIFQGETMHVSLEAGRYYSRYVHNGSYRLVPASPKKPNKAPEPTPMSVTPPAAQESRRP